MMYKKNYNDSSETTREILIKQEERSLVDKKAKPFNFSNYYTYANIQTKKQVNDDFLIWFIGFFEAEGSFTYWQCAKKKRVQIELTQKDPKLMYKIKKNLGFGNVYSFSKNEKRYWRYQIGSQKHLDAFIFLFNGHFMTQHKYTCFSTFIQNYNQIYNQNVMLLKKNNFDLFQNAWLSGFLEGDGGFFSSITYKRFCIKFYLTQKNELTLLNEIKEILHSSNKLGVLKNGQTNVQYNRFETSNLKSLLLLQTYLKKYPFLGQRQILIKRWCRLIDYKIKKYPMTPKAIEKLKRLVNSTKNQ